jgi:hypothetical protein
MPIPFQGVLPVTYGQDTWILFHVFRATLKDASGFLVSELPCILALLFYYVRVRTPSPPPPPPRKRDFLGCIFCGDIQKKITFTLLTLVSAF